MDNIEKVIKGLECCTFILGKRKCNECPYQKGLPDNGCYQLQDDFHALLKKQEAKTPGADSGMCEICSFYERAMPVKAHYNARTNWYECGACRHSMTSGMHCRGELIPAYKVGFCAKCGKAVAWK